MLRLSTGKHSQLLSTVNNNVVDHQYNIGDGTKVYKGVYAVCYGDSFNVFAVENTYYESARQH